MLTLWSSLGAPGRLQLLLAMLLATIASVSGVVLLGLSGWFLVAGALAGSAGLGMSFNHLYPSAGVRGTAFTRVVGRYGEQLTGHGAILTLSARLRPRIFEAGARSRRGLSPLPASELTSLTDDMDAAEGAFLKVILPGLGVMAGCLVALGYTLASDLVLFILAACAMVLTAAGLPFLAVQQSRRRAARLTGRAEAARSDVSRLAENATELDVYGILPAYADQTQSQLSGWQQDAETLESPFRGLSALLSGAGVLMAALALWRAELTGASLPMASGAALALIAAFEAASAMLKVLEAAPRAEAASTRLTERLAHTAADWEPPQETATPLASIFPLQAHRLTATAAPGAPQTPAIDLQIEPGMVIELTGPSGIGKTTLAETLMRLHPASPGSLSYAGKDASGLRIASVLAHIAMSPQMPAFLPGSVADQLRLANPDADDAQMLEALRTAQAADFVLSHPSQLEAPLGDQGAGFSGGELRRLGLARALIANPELLILDEPFAGLDAPLAACLKAALTSWAENGQRSLLILQHHPSRENWGNLKMQQVSLL